MLVHFSVFGVSEIFFPVATSRPKKVTEISGETFAFVARDEMERDINSNRLVLIHS